MTHTIGRWTSLTKTRKLKPIDVLPRHFGVQTVGWTPSKHVSKMHLALCEMDIDRINADVVQKLESLSGGAGPSRIETVFRWISIVAFLLAAILLFGATNSVMPSDVLDDNRKLHDKVDQLSERVEPLFVVKPSDVLEQTKELRMSLDELTAEVKALAEWHNRAGYKEGIETEAIE